MNQKSSTNRCWGSLGASWGRLEGRTDAHRVRAGHLVAFCGVFGCLGTSWGRLGVVLGAYWAVLARLGRVSEASWSTFGASWAVTGAILLASNHFLRHVILETFFN